MSINQILIIIIVVLVSLIIIIGTYFSIVYFINKKREKKIDNIFNPSNLVEEESLMNVMDEKKMLDFVKDNDNSDNFVKQNEEVQVVTSEVMAQEKKTNPFGVDMTRLDKNNDTISYNEPDINSKNKFIK